MGTIPLDDEGGDDGAGGLRFCEVGGDGASGGVVETSMGSTLPTDTEVPSGGKMRLEVGRQASGGGLLAGWTETAVGGADTWAVACVASSVRALATDWAIAMKRKRRRQAARRVAFLLNLSGVGSVVQHQER